MSKSLTPVSASERLPVIDALRGFAILGILVMNIKQSSLPVNFSNLWPSRLEGVVETVTYWGLEFLMNGKFFTLFTLLFGLGMAVQVSRAIEKDNMKKFPMLYVRRLLLLLAIGFMHEIFVWRGVVLLWYPVIGLLLLLFHKLKPKIMLILGFFFISLTCGIMVYQIKQSRPTPAPAAQQAMQKLSPEAQAKKQKEEKAKKLKENQAKCDAYIKIYKEGDYSDIVGDLLSNVPRSLSYLLGLGGYLLGMFLLGGWLWRKKILHDLKAHRPFLKKIFWYSFVIGFLLTSVLTFIRIWGGPDNPGVLLITLFSFVRWFSFPAMCACYVSGFLLLYSKEKPLFKRLVKPIEAVGRMAFSNYIFQSIAMGFIYYSYGFRLIGDTGPVENLLLCFLIFAVQITLTLWWLKYFRFGPIEWLWRRLTYGSKGDVSLSRIQAQ